MFIDKTETALTISEQFFYIGNTGIEKSLLDPSKRTRYKYLLLLADTIKKPAEVWGHFEQGIKDKRQWFYKRRYMNVYEVGGKKKYLLVVFEWEKNGWVAKTEFNARKNYFNKYRIGKMIAGDKP